MKRASFDLMCIVIDRYQSSVKALLNSEQQLRKDCALNTLKSAMLVEYELVSTPQRNLKTGYVACVRCTNRTAKDGICLHSFTADAFLKRSG